MTISEQMQGELSPLTDKLTSFHRLSALSLIVILFSVLIAVNRPWQASPYHTNSRTNNLVFGKLQGQFDKAFNYLALVERLAINTFRMVSQPNQTFGPAGGTLTVALPTYRCSNPVIPCLLNNHALTLQQRFIAKYYNSSQSLQSMMQCLQGNCYTQNGLSLLSRTLWQYRIQDFLMVDRTYIASKLSNTTSEARNWNLAVFPMIGNQLEQDILTTITNISSNWTIKNIAIDGNNQVYLAKEIAIPLAENNAISYQIRIIAHLNNQLLRQSLHSYVSSFFVQSVETNLRVIEKSLGWLNYHYDRTIRFPRNPKDALQRTELIIRLPNDNTTQIMSFELSRYASQISEGQEVEPHFTTYMTLFPLLIVLLVFYYDQQFILQYMDSNFSKMQIINKLYKFNINEMFLGRKPKHSLVIETGQIYEFYEKLSQLPDEGFGYGPIPKSLNKGLSAKREAFKFEWVLKNIVTKYRDFCRPSLQEKNREIMNNKFFINSSLNEVSETEAKNLKEYFLRAKELGLVQPFFKFAYLSLLKPPALYDLILAQDESPLPDVIVKLFRKINHTVRSEDIKRAFRFQSLQMGRSSEGNLTTEKQLRTLSKYLDQDDEAEEYCKNSLNPYPEKPDKEQKPKVLATTEEELKIRVQCNLLLKYLLILKDLDIHNTNAKALSLEKELWSLGEAIENLRYLLGKHNKNIRMYSK